MLEGNLFRIKEGKIDQWKSWCEKINSIYKQEAIETLKEEKVVQEAFLIFNINDVFYTAGIGEGEFLPATERELNKEHRRQSKECLEKIGKVNCLYHLKS